MEMTERCLQCGGALNTDARTGKPVCQYCGTEYKGTDKDLSYELQSIVSRRQMREFIQAEELCHELIQKSPDLSEAYWQLLLVELGVVYVTESGTAKPTFFSYSYTDRESILNNENYKKAISNSKNDEDKAFYEEKAKELDSLLKEFFSLVAKESSYDIFISFKKSEQATLSDGESRTIDTPDYLKAKEIYEHLKDKYRVFFSPVSIGADTGIVGEKYEPRILKALQSAQAMILVGSKKEYLEAQWVENEWRRYQYFMNKGNKLKSSLILAYLQSMPSLPTALKDIQLASVDMFKAGYLSELEAMLSFVKTGKGLKSKIATKAVQSDFLQENQFNYGYNIERVTISNKNGNEVVQISPTEERDLRTATDMRSSKNFKDASALYSAIIRRNPNSARAYWGRFLSSACSYDDSTHIIGEKADLKDFESAIDVSSDIAFSYEMVDYLICAVSKNSSWGVSRKIFDAVAKYAGDGQRSNALLAALKKHLQENIKADRIDISEDVFSCARMLFNEENRSASISFMKDYANALFEAKKYKVARKYYEEVALADNDPFVYLNLLASRLGVSDATTTKFKLSEGSGEDASKKRPSELSLDEIIERIIICANGRYDVIQKVHDMISYQVLTNTKNASPFIEIAVSCYRQLKLENELKALLHMVGNRYLRARDFNNARLYYTEALAENPNDSDAHWGLLKCRVKASNDFELTRHRSKFMSLDEFNNARNCASEADYQHYMDVYNGKAKKETELDNKLPMTGAERGKIIFVSLLKSIPSLLLTVCALLLMFTPLFVYRYVHFAVFIPIFIIGALIGIWQLFYTINNPKAKDKKRKEKFSSTFSVLSSILCVASLIIMIASMTSIPSEPVELSSAEDFVYLKNLPRASKTDFILTNDIDFEGGTSKGFSAIKNYYGTFDGNGYAIKNLHHIAYTADKRFDVNYIGLFQRLNGTVKNLELDECTIKVLKDDPEGRAFVGMISGAIRGGSLINCKFSDSYVVRDNTALVYEGIIANSVTSTSVIDNVEVSVSIFFSEEGFAVSNNVVSNFYWYDEGYYLSDVAVYAEGVRGLYISDSYYCERQVDNTEIELTDEYIENGWHYDENGRATPYNDLHP